MPRWVVANESEGDTSSTDEGSDTEEQEEDNEEDQPGPSSRQNGSAAEEVSPSGKKREKISIPLGKLVCHVSPTL